MVGDSPAVDSSVVDRSAANILASDVSVMVVKSDESNEKENYTWQLRRGKTELLARRIH